MNQFLLASFTYFDFDEQRRSKRQGSGPIRWIVIYGGRFLEDHVEGHSRTAWYFRPIRRIVLSGVPLGALGGPSSMEGSYMIKWYIIPIRRIDLSRVPLVF